MPKPMQANTLILTCLIAGASLFTSSTVTQATSSPFLKYEVNDVLTGYITHTIMVHNPTSNTVTDGKLTVPLIGNETARLYTIVQGISSTMGQPMILQENSQNAYALWENIRIEAQDSFSVEISYQVLSLSPSYTIDSELAGSYKEDSELYRKYTQSEPLIETDNLKITAKAQSITSNCTNVYEKAVKIYDFVIRHLRYAVQDEERGALWALDNGAGDCSEYSYLFVALCRAVGIPARIEAGFVFHYVGETTEDGHMWTEYFLENYGWVPVDPTWRLFNTIDCRHFASIQGKPEAISYANYVFNNTMESELEDKQTVYLKPCPSSAFNNSQFMRDLLRTVQRVKQAKTTVLVAKFSGAALIFRIETDMSEQSLLESKIVLAEAIEDSEASKFIDSTQRAEDAARTAWVAIVKTMAAYLGALVIVLIGMLVFLTRRAV